jgi:3D (Asp-Asp-Asp) domain-containing protein
LRNRAHFSLFFVVAGALFLGACGTTSTLTTRTSPLPKYEAPLVKRDFQSIRTTAYTHTEADHRRFTDHNALGGQLHAATGAIRRAEYTPRALPVNVEEQSDYRRASYTPATVQPFSLEPRRTTKVVKTKHGKKRVVVIIKPQIGSAAADWSRWPAGTTFRVLSTGQKYRVEDYGWALSGRNTIDLYMATPRDMNSWGMRQEKIQVLHWGNPQESLRLLQPHQASKHIRRMILELEGQEQEAAALQ